MTVIGNFTKIELYETTRVNTRYGNDARRYLNRIIDETVPLTWGLIMW